MKNNVEVIETNYNTMCGVKLYVRHTVFLIIKGYMPCDLE